MAASNSTKQTNKAGGMCHKLLYLSLMSMVTIQKVSYHWMQVSIMEKVEGS